MRTVTQLEWQKKRKGRINVYLDGEFAFGLDEVDAARLKKGQQLSDEEVASLQALDEASRAFEMSLRYLSLRPRSSHELRQYLLRKSFTETTMVGVIERLSALNYINDADFARLWVESRQTAKPLGQRALRYELRHKGLPAELIDATLEAEGEDEAEAAYRAAQSRLRRLRGQTEAEFRADLSAFLQRRGFSYSDSSAAIRRLIDELQETEPAFFAADAADD